MIYQTGSELTQYSEVSTWFYHLVETDWSHEIFSGCT